MGCRKARREMKIYSHKKIGSKKMNKKDVREYTCVINGSNKKI